MMGLWDHASETTPGDRDARPSTRGQADGSSDRRPDPTGQYKTEKFPVLHYGSVPNTDLSKWDLRVFGEVDNPFTLTWDEFKALPRKQVTTDIHCVTRWTKLDTPWEGVPIQEILSRAQLRPTATHVLAHSEQGYTANLPLSVLDDDDVLLADTYDGRPLDPEHGWPLRLFVRSATSGRVPSGSAGSSSSITTSSASGSATATTTTPTPGRRSVSASRAVACWAADRFVAGCGPRSRTLKCARCGPPGASRSTTHPRRTQSRAEGP